MGYLEFESFTKNNKSMFFWKFIYWLKDWFYYVGGLKKFCSNTFKTTLKKKKKVRGLILLDSKIYYKTTITKTGVTINIKKTGVSRNKPPLHTMDNWFWQRYKGSPGEKRIAF